MSTEEIKKRLQRVEELIHSSNPDEEIGTELLQDDLKRAAEEHRNEERGYRHQALDCEMRKEEYQRAGDEKSAEENYHNQVDNERKASVHRAAAEIAEELIRIIAYQEEEQQTA